MKHNIKRMILTLLACAVTLSISCSPASEQLQSGSATTDAPSTLHAEETNTQQTEDEASSDISTDTPAVDNESISGDQTSAPIQDGVLSDQTSGITQEDVDTSAPVEDTDGISTEQTSAPVQDEETNAPQSTSTQAVTDAPSEDTTHKASETVKDDETTPIETKPIETKPIETKPVETEPVETEPVETTAPHVHAHSAWTVTKKATCTESGTETRTCTCGNKQTRTVKAQGHTEITVKGKAATCEESGLTDGKKCSVCGTVTVKQATIQAKGHKYVTVSEPNGDPYSADFMKSGQEKCSACGDEQEIKYAVPNVSDEEYARLLAKRMLYYINEYRKAEGSPTAQMLPNMTEYAEYRAVQLSTNFAHDDDDEAAAALALKYGQYNYGEITYLDLETMEVVHTGVYREYYAPMCGEAIMKGGFFQTARKYDPHYIDTEAKDCAKTYYESAGHWGYIGRDTNVYISIGVYFIGDMQYNCVCTSDTDIYG